MDTKSRKALVGSVRSMTQAATALASARPAKSTGVDTPDACKTATRPPPIVMKAADNTFDAPMTRERWSSCAQA
ncbi:hypothetical protein D9M72_455690 [compost metagenome]